MVKLPRLVIAAPSTGQGKTTVATGLMAALRGSGLEVSGHKVGPDYIDPGYHGLATGRSGRNLDPHLVGEKRIVPLLLHGANTPRRADIAVIEGVMGLYDGRLGMKGFASTAHVAKLTDSPVVVVLDIARLSRSAAAMVAGLAAFDPAVNIAGVVINQARSPRNTQEIVEAIESIGVTVLGSLPTDDRLRTPSRHLGLVPAAERAESARMIRLLGEQVSHYVDLDRIWAIADSAPALNDTPWQASVALAGSAEAAGLADSRCGKQPTIAMAGGQAFTFRYPETEELLTAAGCQIVTFDPLNDSRLPSGVQGIYLGGGFPEVFAQELGNNTSLLADLRAAIATGVPTVAECAGLLYLAQTLDGVAMAQAVPATAAMHERLTLRYPQAEAAGTSLLTRLGDVVTGHEFHRTRTEPVAGGHPAWVIDGDPTGFASATLHASYLHVHWAGHPQLARRFAAAARAAKPHVSDVSDESTDSSGIQNTAEQADTPSTDLLHHGDREVEPGFADFAVNVYAGNRPPWLDDTLHDSLSKAGNYPNVAAAHAAIAAQHERSLSSVLATAGVAEAFTLIAGVRRWRRPVVVTPQFTEPQAALLRAGHQIDLAPLALAHGFAAQGAVIHDDADLVVLGNPTNPTGVLHSRSWIESLLQPGRLVVVDEAFMDTVPDEMESLATTSHDGLIVLRSLTKHWSIPGIRAGYLVGDPHWVRELARAQTPWSVSTPALAALATCSTAIAREESRRRAQEIARWRDNLQSQLADREIGFIPSSASFVLARVGFGVHQRLRDQRIAVRRADTFDGLTDEWVRIAVRPPQQTRRLAEALDVVGSNSSAVAHGLPVPNTDAGLAE